MKDSCRQARHIRAPRPVDHPDGVEEIVAMVVQRAQEGDMTAAKMVLDRVAPAPADRLISFAKRRIEKSRDAIDAASDVLTAVADGKITISEADRISKLLRDYIETSAAQEFDGRLAALEAALPPAP
jgi:hypothetical protein